VLGAGSGGSLPGRIIRRLSPDYVRRRAAVLPFGSIVVSGTNGKTTTASMLRAILARHGLIVTGNDTGANLRSGVASALLWSRRDAEIGVFEVDEGALPEMVSEIRPRVLVLTNVFRDQLDRFGEPEHVADLLARAARSLPPEGVVVANADDHWLWRSIEDLVPVGFGVAAMPADAAPPREVRTVEGEPEMCWSCGHALEYLHRTFGHLGAARCERCGWTWSRPPFQARVSAATLERTSFEIAGAPVTLGVGGIHNVYNAAAAIAAADALGIDLMDSVAALGTYEPRFGRNELLNLDGHRVFLALTKNPAGARVSIDQVLSDPRVGAVVVSVSDRTADGRDISWIWDADFERLIERRLPVVASGRRAADVAVRLKYAGATKEPVERDPLAAIRAAQAACPPDRLVAVLATYTAMLDVRRAVAGRRAHRLVDARAA
jgi:lipid II isoglutaminyl synthase (glutamine-hydrolysing)